MKDVLNDSEKGKRNFFEIFSYYLLKLHATISTSKICQKKKKACAVECEN